MPDPTTTLGIPYPVGSDLVANGPAQMQALAQAVDGLLPSSTNGTRGSSIILSSHSTSSTAYTTMSTPDQVTGIVLPATGLLSVWFQGTWQESVAGAARAALFIGANQLQIAYSGGASPVAAATGDTNAGFNLPLASTQAGIATSSVGAAVNTDAGDVTTGQAVGLFAASPGVTYEFLGGVRSVSGAGTGGYAVLGGPCHIFCAAGTYSISVRFKASSGSVTATNRRLWVEARSFA